jgi:hypothetical protein
MIKNLKNSDLAKFFIRKRLYYFHFFAGRFVKDRRISTYLIQAQNSLFFRIPNKITPVREGFFSLNFVPLSKKEQNKLKIKENVCLKYSKGGGGILYPTKNPRYANIQPKYVHRR